MTTKPNANLVMHHRLGIYYEVLEAPTAEELSTKVNNALSTGWRCVGGMAIDKVRPSQEGQSWKTKYCQAVERE